MLECRFNLPAPEVEKAIVRFAKDPVPFFDYLGRQHNATHFTVDIERSCMDAFMNTYSPHISESIGANSNVSMGDVLKLFYCTNYCSKGTQEEDRTAFERVLQALSSRIAAVSCRGMETGDSDDNAVYKEGLSRLYGAILAKNQAAIVSAPLAHYIVMNGSRFYFSDDFASLPLKLFEKDADGFDPPCYIKNVKGSYIQQSTVYDYKFRPRELENTCLWDFCSSYEVKTLTKRNSANLFSFTENHPGFRVQGVSRRERRATPKIQHWCFPDLRNVGRIMSYEATTVGQKVLREKYAKLVLILFCPHRSTSDLKAAGEGENSFMRKYQQFVTSNIAESHKEILNNIQQCHNCIRLQGKSSTDALDGTSKFSDDRGSDETEGSDVLEDFDIEDVDFNDFQNCFDLGGGIKIDQNTSKSENVPVAKFCEESVFVRTNRNTSRQVQTFPTSRNKVSLRNLIQLRSNTTRRPENVNSKYRGSSRANGTKSSIDAWADGYNLDRKQRLAFRSMVSSFVLTWMQEAVVTSSAEETASHGHRRHSREMIAEMKELNGKDQLLMFMTGPGGAGKSRVIDGAQEYSKEYVENLGLLYHKNMIVVTALTGIAATSIGGETSHKAMHLNASTENIEHCEVMKWKDTRLVIVDEISFGSGKVLEQINEKLSFFGQKGKVYGGFNVVFSGDFRQLKPVGGDSIYLKRRPLWDNSLNTYVELNGMHRFAEDPEWGQILQRFREGVPLPSDFKTINSRLLATCSDPVPDDTRYACFFNKSRNEVHRNMFSAHLSSEDFPADAAGPEPPSHTVVVKGKMSFHNSGNSVGKSLQDLIYSLCSDADFKNGDSLLGEPMLTLYNGALVMVNQNIDVSNNIANGTVCIFRGVQLKVGATCHKQKINGKYVWCVYSDELENMTCEILTDDGSPGKTIYLETSELTYVAQVPVLPGIKMGQKLKMEQFPVILATACTGHKLQGQSLKHLVVHEWRNSPDWVYVALSRVRKLGGLFLKSPLNPMQDYSVCEELVRHNERLKMRRQETNFSWLE